MKRMMIKTMVAVAALAAFGVAQAQISERTIKFATQNPKGHPMVLGMERFAENVSKKSGGKIKVNLFPGGVLGGDQANVSAVQGGTLCTNGKWRAFDNSINGTTPYRVFFKDGVFRGQP